MTAVVPSGGGQTGPHEEVPPPCLSVVVPTYQGDAWLGACLDSLAQQSASRTDYEIVVVQNGPPTEAARIVAEKIEQYEGLRARYGETATAGASAARNHGLDLAQGDYVTFVDDDDRVGRRFLEALLACAAPDVVAGTSVGFIHDGAFDDPRFDNYIARELEPLRGQQGTNRQLSVMAAYTWAKVVRTEHARRIRFDETLPNGQDVVFWTTLITTLPVRLALAGGEPDTAYLYHVRQGSLMQVGAAPSWEHRVERRIRVLMALQAIRPRDAESEWIRRRMMHDHCAAFIRPYLLANPDEVPRVDAALRAAGLREVPWTLLHRGLARSLSIMEPALDSSGETAGERLAERGVVTDVLTYVPAHAPETGDVLAGGDSVSDEHIVLTGPEAVTWELLDPLVKQVLGLVSRREESGQGYLTLYSRSAGPLEHLLAAMVKLARPHLTWTAELAKGTTHARPRGARAEVVQDQVLAVLGAGLAEAGHAVDAVPEAMGEFSAFVARALADEVIEAAVADDVEHESHEVRVSVIVPTYRGEAWIGECLDTLAAQTVPSEEFEIVVVDNGPESGTRELIRAWCRRHPDMQVRCLRSEVASVSHARNLGLEAARGEYVTFVDDDDRVGPRFLEGLLRAAAPGVLPIVLGGWVHDERWEDPAFDTHTGALPLRFAGRQHSNLDVAMVLHPVWAKLVRTALALQVRFDETLSGYAEDTVFWLRVLEVGRLRIVLADSSREAAYLYRVRQGSLTQWHGQTSWDVHVEAPLRAVDALRASEDPEVRAIGAVLARAPFAKMNEYLRQHPDEVDRVVAALRERGIEDVPWGTLCAGLPSELAIVDGVVDAAGRTAGARLLERGRPADALTYAAAGADMSAALGVAGALTGRHIALSGTAPASWDLLARLTATVRSTIDSIEAETAAYGGLFSHSAGPLEHLLAAMVRLARPGLRWEAELAVPVAGTEIPGATAAVEADGLLDVLVAGLVEAGFAGEEVPSEMGAFAELAVCVLADEIVFATEAHRDRVLARLDADVAEGARLRSRVLRPVPRPEDLAVSVVVPTYQGDDWLGDCLRSLAAQTLPATAFEVVVVRNGPPSNAAEIVATVAAAHPGLQVRLLESEQAGVSRARNLGLDEARGEYVTFVDDDDRVAPRYLESLLAAAGPDAIATGLIAHVTEGNHDRPDWNNWLARPVRRWIGGQPSAADLSELIQPAVAKLAPTALARKVRFDEEMSFAEDTVFWFEVLAQGSAGLRLTEAGADAAYLYQIRTGSVTGAGAGMSWDFHVIDHLDGAAALHAVQTSDAGLCEARRLIVGRFMGIASAYARTHPDEAGRVEQEMAARGLLATV